LKEKSGEFSDFREIERNFLSLEAEGMNSENSGILIIIRCRGTQKVAKVFLF
jgi:environmental stress-induced protein Ves